MFKFERNILIKRNLLQKKTSNVNEGKIIFFYTFPLFADSGDKLRVSRQKRIL